jgi:hypothetical protein
MTWKDTTMKWRLRLHQNLPAPQGALIRNGPEFPGQIRTPVTSSTLGELERFAAAMRAEGAEDGSVVGADIRPSSQRRNAGTLAVLWGYPRSTTGDADPPPPGAGVIP